jgi:hypothetical protein
LANTGFEVWAPGHDCGEDQEDGPWGGLGSHCEGAQRGAAVDARLEEVALGKHTVSGLSGLFLRGVNCYQGGLFFARVLIVSFHFPS